MQIGTAKGKGRQAPSTLGWDLGPRRGQLARHSWQPTGMTTGAGRRCRLANNSGIRHFRFNPETGACHPHSILRFQPPLKAVGS